jgi:hypothetical protein
MRSKRSRLALVGVLALVLSVTMGLASGGVADAKKKGKKKAKSATVTVSYATPTPIPAQPTPDGNRILTSVPLTVGKKAKGKVVAFDSVRVTTTFTGSDNVALGSISSRLTAPNGRSVFLHAPFWNFVGSIHNTTSGPLTETADTQSAPCLLDATHPCPGGLAGDPNATVAPPYVGTIQNPDLAAFGGIPAKGTWILKIQNSEQVRTATLNSVSITIALKNAPV